MDHLLQQGAKNAVNTCMNITLADRVFIVVDDVNGDIGSALEGESRALGAETICIHLEQFGSRPMTDMPDALAERLTSFKPTVTFYAATIHPNELNLRMALVGKAMRELGARHAHMPGITQQIMREGMSADYTRVKVLTERLQEFVKKAGSLHVTSQAGSDMRVQFDKKFKWVADTGMLHEPLSFGNLPGGEVYTTPALVEGVFAARVFGDYFSQKYGVLAHPVLLEMKENQLVDVKNDINGIGAELMDYLGREEKGRGLGEFAIGTNLAVKSLVGNILQDEKIPGVHIAFGDPLGAHTGADWHCSVHVDVVDPYCTIQAGDVILMQDGEFRI